MTTLLGKPVSLRKMGLYNAKYLFVAKKIENGMVTGHTLQPSESSETDSYLFGEEEELPISAFPSGFDYIYYGDCVGGISTDYLSEFVLTNYPSTRFQ